MPLGSVEEWRARIGSSWCALGRPVKSVSGGGVTRPLSGEIMLQVLYVLMMLTLVVVLQRVRKMNKSLSGYHKELRSSIHPRTTAKRLLFIMILLLQAQSFIQSSLLLKCGDIESNPGPDLDYDNIDNSTVLTEDDLRDVFLEVVNIQTTYYQFGMVLGLPPRELDAIRKAFKRDITQCFTEVLLVWLRHRYNVDKYGPPTWRRLVDAVDSPSGGNNHALAKAIASKHPSQPVQTTVSPTIGASLQEHIESNHLRSGEDYDVHINESDGEQSFERNQESDLLVPGSRGSSRNLIQRCSDTMAAYYLRQVDERAWPPIKATNFINLALVKDQTSWRRTVPKSVDDVVGDKENTSYYDMLNDIDNSRLILLEGRPGCGKTTLLSKISRDWSNGKILKSKLVIFVPLRSLNDEHDRSLSTLIRVACPTLPPNDLKQLVSSIEKAQGSNTVFVFDGLNEYRPIYYVAERNRFLSLFRKNNPPPFKHEDVFDLLKAENLPKALVILSSRPVACKDFRHNAGKQLEVLGFLKPQVIEYVHHYFHNDKKKAQQLVSHLEHHPNLMNMAYLPLHCAMLVFLYEDGTVLPDTETEFYKHFTLFTLVRALRKRNSLKGDFSLTSFTDLPRDDKRLFDVVCQLAFDATVASKQVFKYSELKHKLFEVGSIVCDESSLGLVVIDRYFMRCGHDETYTFLHLTFQEYLAAVHIAGLSEHKRREIINTHKHAINLPVVWRFMCGMMDYSIPSAMDVFRSLLETGNLLFKFQCCYESQHLSTCTHVIKYFDKELKFSSINLSPSDCTAIGYTVKANPDPVCITFENCELSSEGALSFFHHINQHPFSLTLRLTGSAMDSCLEGLKQCPVPGLLSLNLSHNNIERVGVQAIGEALKHCVVLENLDLSHCNIGSVGARAIGEALKHCVVLENLDLQNNSIGDKGAVVISEAMKTMTNLRWLSLQNNSIGDKGAVAISEAMKTITNLQKLYLSENSIGDEGAVAVSKAMKTMTNLQELGLYNNSIGDKGAMAVSEAIKTMSNLQKLDLYNNSIGDKGAMAASEAMSNLQKLDLWDNETERDKPSTPSGHILLKHELVALAKLLAAYSNEKLKEIKVNLQNNQGGDISREEVERSLRECGLKSIADDLKQNLAKSVEDQQHYEAYESALQGGLALTMQYLKFLFFGPPRTGKSTARRRLVQEIVNLDRLGEPSASTGVAEANDVIIKKLTSEPAAISGSQWWSIKKSKEDGEIDEGDCDHLAQLFYMLISKTKSETEQTTTVTVPATISEPALSTGEDESEESVIAETSDIKEASSSLKSPRLQDHIEKDLVAEFQVELSSKSLIKSKEIEIDEAFKSKEIEIDEAFKKLTSTLKSDSPEELRKLLENLTMLNMVDIGGQSAFLELCPAFTTGPALYFIFFRLDQELKKNYQIKFQSSNGEETILESSYCTETVIHQTLSSIACFERQSTAESAKSEPAKSAPAKSEPLSIVSGRAILIGTYKDQVDDERISQIDTTLRQQLLPTELHDKELLLRTSKDRMFYSLNNMTGNDSEMSPIRNDIEEIIKQFFPAVPIPVSWLMFRILLHFLHKPIVSLPECEEIARRLPMNTPVQDAIWFFHHNIGSLMHYPDIPSMKDMVICDSQIVFDSTSELIIDTFKIGNRAIPATAVDDFHKKGQFSLEHIKDRTEIHRKNQLSLEQLVDLLKSHNILAEIKSDHESSEQLEPSQEGSAQISQCQPKFVMPAVLKEASEEELKLEDSKQEAAPLMICFEGGFVPFGVFCASVANLIAHQDTLSPRWQLCDDQVLKNKVKFSIDKTFYTTLISRPLYLEIRVERHSRGRSKQSLPNICSTVRQTVVQALETVITKMRYNVHAKMETPTFPTAHTFNLSFTCCMEESHSDHLMKVHKDENEYFGECPNDPIEFDLEEKHLVWFNQSLYPNKYWSAPLALPQSSSDGDTKREEELLSRPLPPPRPLPPTTSQCTDVHRENEVKAQQVVKSGQITDPDRLFNNIAMDIHSKYMEIGIELGLKSEVLTNELETGILTMLPGNRKALKMLQLWQQSVTEDDCTYAVLAAALEKNGFKSYADKYCYTTENKDTTNESPVEETATSSADNSTWSRFTVVVMICSLVVLFAAAMLVSL